MTALERESAQDFAALTRTLLATKLSQSTAVALLTAAVDRIEHLVNALGDQETELAHALHDATTDVIPYGPYCRCCGRPVREDYGGYCLDCVALACDQVRARIADEFAPPFNQAGERVAELPVHWLNLDDGSNRVACKLPPADEAVASSTSKATVTCEACRALPEFGAQQRAALQVLPGGADAASELMPAGGSQ